MKKLAIITGLLITIMIMSSFLSFIFGSSFSPKRKLAYKVAENFSKKMKAKHCLQYLGISEAAPNGTYDSIGLLFNYPHILSKDQGRILVLSCVEDLLNDFNSVPEFRQYMTDSPFTSNNIKITIFIEPPNISNVYYPDISVFSFFDNTLWFSTDSLESKPRYHSREKESYEEAKQIIEKQQSKVIGN